MLADARNWIRISAARNERGFLISLFITGNGGENVREYGVRLNFNLFSRVYDVPGRTRAKNLPRNQRIPRIAPKMRKQRCSRT